MFVSLTWWDNISADLVEFYGFSELVEFYVKICEVEVTVCKDILMFFAISENVFDYADVVYAIHFVKGEFSEK